MSERWGMTCNNGPQLDPNATKVPKYCKIFEVNG